VKISKHLAYLRTRGMVTVLRRANWMVYSLPAKRSAELEANLACLQDCSCEDPTFKADRQELRKLAPSQNKGPSCCSPSPKAPRRAPSLKP